MWFLIVLLTLNLGTLFVLALSIRTNQRTLARLEGRTGDANLMLRQRAQHLLRVGYGLLLVVALLALFTTFRLAIGWY